MCLYIIPSARSPVRCLGVDEGGIGKTWRQLGERLLPDLRRQTTVHLTIPSLLQKRLSTALVICAFEPCVLWTFI